MKFIMTWDPEMVHSSPTRGTIPQSWNSQVQFDTASILTLEAIAGEVGASDGHAFGMTRGYGFAFLTPLIRLTIGSTSVRGIPCELGASVSVRLNPDRLE